MATFPLKIMTPDGVAFDGAVTSVSCRTINGQLQLLARHIDICTALGMGEAHIKLEDGTVRRAACMGGMLSMLGGECHLLATTFEWADAIDAERAARSKARAAWPPARIFESDCPRRLAGAFYFSNPPQSTVVSVSNALPRLPFAPAHGIIQI